MGNTGKKGKTPGKVYPTSDLAMRHPNNYCLEILDWKNVFLCGHLVLLILKSNSQYVFSHQTTSQLLFYLFKVNKRYTGSKCKYAQGRNRH